MPYLLIFLFMILSNFSFALHGTKQVANFAPELCDEGVLTLPNTVGVTELASEKAEYCFNKALTVLVSKNCNNADCDLIKKAKAFKGKLTYKSIGTPGSWFCDELGGKSHGMLFDYKGTKSIIHVCGTEKDIVSAEYLRSFMGRANK